MPPSPTDTEIDWKAYMEQVAQYQAGERDYALIKGGTGPLVYPAGHVYIYSFLYNLTDQGRDVLKGQWIFMALYLATLAVVLLCYREARVIIQRKRKERKKKKTNLLHRKKEKSKTY